MSRRPRETNGPMVITGTLRPVKVMVVISPGQCAEVMVAKPSHTSDGRGLNALII